MASSQSGGMFSTPKVEISTETQKLLKGTMSSFKFLVLYVRYDIRDAQL